VARREAGLTSLSIVCPNCGADLPGETAEDLVDRMLEHIDQEHPELLGRYTDDDLLDRVRG
jgi:predicted small metal-binding protein